MKYSMALAFVAALAACGPGRPGTQASPGGSVAAPDGISISGPFCCENLSVFVLSKAGAPRGAGEYLTLDEAMTAGALKITERGEGAAVNELSVENLGASPIYLQAGDTVKGGRQDRTIAADWVLPPGGGQVALPVFCVEPGRWSQRASSDGASFTAAPVPLATKEQKLAVRLEKDQARVWQAGRSANTALATREADFRSSDRDGCRVADFWRSDGAGLLQEAGDSYVLASEQAGVQAGIRPYLEALAAVPTGREDVVGMAFAINGKISTAEVYCATGLFKKLWPRLLRSAAVEALSKKADPRAKDATVNDVSWLLAESMKAEERREKSAADTELGVRRSLHAVQFDTRWKGLMLHRQCAKLD